MKQNIHPKWHRDSVVTCNCGNTFTTGANNKEIQVDICSACHPFFTGEMRFVDRQGRVDKFMAKMKKAKSNTKTRKAKTAQDEKEEVKSYKELLRDQQITMKQDAKAEKSEEKTETSKEDKTDKKAEAKK